MPITWGVGFPGRAGWHRAARWLPCSGPPARVCPSHGGARSPARPLRFGVAPGITLCCSLCREPWGQPRRVGEI